jgi:predicted unusual protein kinase regulating ubiquinone biosynthesis (AarF/ABC1/UbiB family)
VQFSPKGEPRLVVLDCGIVYSSRSDAEHEKLVDICLAFMQHDGVKAGQLMIDNAREKHGQAAGHAQHEEQFCKSIQQIVLDCEKENYFEHMGDYLARICDLARQHMVKFDPGYFKIAMALKVAEGIAIALDKELDLVSKCIPIVVKARALRKLGIQKFPEPEPDDEFMPELEKAKK